MNINLTDEQMQLLVSKALFETLTEENKKELLTDSIKHLLQPSTDRYSNKKSPLQDAFERALYSITNKLIAEELEKDDVVKNEITKLYNEALQKIFTGEEREKLVNRLASGISTALSTYN